jgi:glutathione-independent formaldehyde dehydrogenase
VGADIADLDGYRATLEQIFRASGAYVTGDPGAKDEAARQGSLSIRIGLGWAKSHSFATGQCPVMRYHRQLMNMILNERCQIAKAVNATVIPLDEAPRGYRDFDGGVAKKFVLDPHGMLGCKQRIGA